MKKILKFLKISQVILIALLASVLSSRYSEISDSYSRLNKQSEVVEEYLNNFSQTGESSFVATADSIKINEDLRNLSYHAHMIKGLVEHDNTDSLKWPLVAIFAVIIIPTIVERTIKQTTNS